jgi:fatty-acyl-CoA synthase
MAWIRLQPGASTDEKDLAAHCQQRLASFKVPRFWQFVREFPMTASGKIQKFRLRTMAVELLGLQFVAEEKTA